MNDADKIDLFVTDANDIEYLGQCDKCNNPLRIGDEGYISETNVYCKECVKEREKSLSFMKNIKRDKFHFYYPFLDEDTNKKSNQ